MARTNILPIHWRLIEETVREGACVPFLGPGVNAPYDGYPGLPVNSDVALALLKELIDLREEAPGKLAQVTVHEAFQDALQEYGDLMRVGVDDLARVALRFQFFGGSNHLVRRLRELRDDSEHNPSLLLQKLAEQPFRLMVTTNYDRLLEKALAGRCLVLSQPALDSAVVDPRVVEELLYTHSHTEEGPIVYKFCGSFESMVARAHAGDVAAPEPGSLPGEQRAFLLENLDASFSRGELKELLWLMEIRYDNLPGEGTRAKIVEFLERLERENRIAELLPLLKQKRPRIRWDVVKQSVSRPGSGLATRPREVPHSQHVTVTEEDYLEVLTAAGDGARRRIPRQLQALLNSSSLLLFLGFNLEGWEFRTIFKALVEHEDARTDRRLIAIQAEPTNFWVDFWRDKEVECYDLYPSEFARQLQERL